MHNVQGGSWGDRQLIFLIKKTILTDFHSVKFIELLELGELCVEDHLGQMLPERFLAVVHSLLEIFDYGTENFVVDRADFLDNVVLEVLRRFGVVRPCL